MALEPASSHHRASGRGRWEVLPFCAGDGSSGRLSDRMVGVVGRAGSKASSGCSKAPKSTKSNETQGKPVSILSCRCLHFGFLGIR